ncbi:MAG: oligosaccharide flippase family protein [Bacteroidota bacterium]|nr:oligosaccharide flippase family protein [Bacteroidota bacterium]
MIDKLKQLTKDTAIYGISTILGRFLNFLLVPFYTHVFIPDQYGIISNYYAFIGLMNIIFLYGMDSAYLKYASQKEIGDEKDNFSTPFLSVVFSSVLFALAIVIFREPLVTFLGAPRDFSFVYYTAAILIVDSLAVIPFVALRLDRKAKKFSFIKVSNILLNVVLNLFFILKLKWGIESVFVANIAASGLSLVLLIPSIWKKLKFKIHKDLYKHLVKFGLPYLPAGIGAMIVQVIDRPILAKLTDLKTVGIYQANYKLGIFMMLFVNMFQFAWQPFFMQNAKEKDAKELFSKVLTYFTISGGLILISLSLFIDNLVKIQIFGRAIIAPAYWGGLNIVPVVLLGYLFNGIYIVFTAGIFIKEKSNYVPFIIGFAALLNIVVNFFAIPVFGIMGAAFATFISYFVMAAGFYFVTQKFYRIEYEYKKIINIFASILIIGSAYYYSIYLKINTIPVKAGLFLLFIGSIYFCVLDKRETSFIKKKLKRF